MVLFAQPELDERLNEKQFRQLRQRITFSYKLRAMNVKEVQHYIQHRMQVAGYKGASLFSQSLCKKITQVSQGIPRLVNILCHKMLMLSYGQGQYQMTRKHLSAAIADTEGIVSKPSLKQLMLVGFAFVILAIVTTYFIGIL